MSRRADYTPFLAVPQTPSAPTSPKKRTAYRHSPQTPQNGFQHSRSNSADRTVDQPIQKRLVEQFYKVDVRDKPATDTQRMFRFGSSLAADRSESPEASRGGCVAFQRFDTDIASPSETAEALINIDAAADAFDLAEVERLLDSAARTVARLLDTSSPLPSSKKQFDHVDRYLDEVGRKVDHCRREMASDMRVTRDSYAARMEQTVEKIDRLRELLRTLSLRVDRAREAIASSKSVLSDDIARKVRVLEHVLQRFQEYEHVNRQRGVRQLIVGLTGGALLMCVYIACREW